MIFLLEINADLVQLPLRTLRLRSLQPLRPVIFLAVAFKTRILETESRLRSDNPLLQVRVCLRLFADADWAADD
jgi:hypothetical protein